MTPPDEAVEALAECWAAMEVVSLGGGSVVRFLSDYVDDAKTMLRRLAALGWELRKKQQEG